ASPSAGRASDRAAPAHRERYPGDAPAHGAGRVRRSPGRARGGDAAEPRALVGLLDCVGVEPEKLHGGAPCFEVSEKTRLLRGSSLPGRHHVIELAGRNDGDAIDITDDPVVRLHVDAANTDGFTHGAGADLGGTGEGDGGAE